MREKPYCDLRIHVMADRAIMPTDACTPSRWHVAVEPVEVFDYRNRTEFIAACKRMIGRGMPEISNLSESEIVRDSSGPVAKNPIELKYASLASWDELERKSIYVTVTCFSSGFHLQSWNHGTDGKWSDQQAIDIFLDTSVGVEGLVDTILEHLQTRTDLLLMT